MNVLGVKTFVGSFYKDKLPVIKKGHCCIINLDDSYSGRGGTHWTCFYNMGAKNYYFDSYGLPPPEQIAGKYKNIHYSNNQYQDDTAVTCGYYCIYLLHELDKGTDFYDILYEMDLTNTLDNENFITKYFS